MNPLLIPMLLSYGKQALGWFKNNPIQSLQLAGIAALAITAAFFFFDYRGAKAEVRELRTEIAAEKALNEAQATRLDEFAEAEVQRLERLRALEEAGVRIRAEIRGITDELTAPQINIIVEEQPDEAADIISRRFDDILSVLDDATRPD